VTANSVRSPSASVETLPVCVDVDGTLIATDLVRIRTVWRAPGRRGNIDQPAVLFPRELASEVGGLNVGNHCTMNYELWVSSFWRAQDSSTPYPVRDVQGPRPVEDRTGLGNDSITHRDSCKPRLGGTPPPQVFATRLSPNCTRTSVTIGARRAGWHAWGFPSASYVLCETCTAA
jgi:hypothetical protein